MAYKSIQTHVSDGTLESVQFSIAFLSTEHLHFYVDDVEITTSTASHGVMVDGVDEYGVTLTTAVPSGAVFKVQRQTPRDNVPHVFSTGAALFTALTTDANNEYLLYVVQETCEQSGQGPFPEITELVGTEYVTVEAGGARKQITVQNFLASVASTTALTLDLANDTDPAKGAGMVGLPWGKSVAEEFLTHRGAVDVTHYPFLAKGDGEADDTLAIQSALDTGLNVYVPPQNFLVSAPLRFTRANQMLFGVGSNGINTTFWEAPKSVVGLSHIFTNSPIQIIVTGNFPGQSIKGICFNGNGVATGGVSMAPLPEPLVFAALVEDVFVCRVSGIALDTGYCVDSTFDKVRIDGATSTNQALTSVAIRNGATNNAFANCWVENCKTNLLAVGSIANFTNCTFSTMFASGRQHIRVAGDVSKYTFTDSYFENSTILAVDSGKSIGGALEFRGCFLSSNNPTSLMDLTGAIPGGQVGIFGGRIHEYSTSNIVILPSGVSGMALGVGQRGVAFNGAGTGASYGYDFYKEGTFTPIIAGTTTAGTFTPLYGTIGRYTKIGRIVHFDIWASWGGGTGTGNFKISGLPFTSNPELPNSAATIGSINGLSPSAGKYVSALVRQGSGDVVFYQTPTGEGASSALPYAAGGDCNISGCYMV